MNIEKYINAKSPYVEEHGYDSDRKEVSIVLANREFEIDLGKRTLKEAIADHQKLFESQIGDDAPTVTVMKADPIPSLGFEGGRIWMLTDQGDSEPFDWFVFEESTRIGF